MCSSSHSGLIRVVAGDSQRRIDNGRRVAKRWKKRVAGDFLCTESGHPSTVEEASGELLGNT